MYYLTNIVFFKNCQNKIRINILAIKGLGTVDNGLKNLFQCYFEPGSVNIRHLFYGVFNPFNAFPAIRIEQEQNTDSDQRGLLFPVNHIHPLMICQKVDEPVHEFFRSWGNLHYQSEKMRLKMSSLRLRTISSSN